MAAADLAVREVHGAKTNSQAEKNGAQVIASVLVVRTAVAVEVRALPTAAVMAHQEVYALSGVSVKTVRHDPFRTHTAPRNLR